MHHRTCLSCLLVWILMVWGGVAPAQDLVPTVFPSSTAAAEAWAGGPGTPAAQAERTGVRFTIPFDREMDRVYWDADVRLDLSSTPILEIDLSCDRPEAMRSLMIYAKSGAGWYIWTVPLIQSGRSVVSLHRSRATVEGTPTGWDRIERIRISPWKGEAVAASLLLHGLTAQPMKVIIVQGETGYANAGEKSVGRTAANRVSRWLGLGGIPHTVISESEAARGLASGISVVILPYNPQLSTGFLKTLRNAVNRGAKLIVMYSSSDSLAGLMEVALQPAQQTRDISRWREIQWIGRRPAPAPERTYQTSWSIGPIRPVGRDARVAAVWGNAIGQASKDVALVETRRGFWFSSVLQEDDETGKTDLLVALCGELDPSLLFNAAAQARRGAGRLGSRPSFAASLDEIQRLASRSSLNRDTLEAFSARAKALNHRVQSADRNHSPDKLLGATRALDGVMRMAYSLGQEPKSGEWCAVWEHDGTGLYPGDWDRTCRMLADHGVTALFVNALWAGLAHYPSEFAPPSNTYKHYGDQLAQAVKAARAHGLEVHLWMVCWMLDNAPADFVARQAKAGALQQTADGKQKSWLNPASPAARSYQLSLIREAITRYDLDGIHLDYIRYPDRNSDYGPLTRRTFTADTGISPARWPGDVQSGGPNAAAFDRWRCEQVSSFVREVRKLTRSLDPKLQLSAAVWGGYPDIVHSIGQDWAEWIARDWVDFVCPMNYADRLPAFTALLASQAQLPQARQKVRPGIGVTSGESRLTSDQVIEQILAVRRAGYSGFALFDLSKTLELDTLPALRRGVLRQP
ncbi:MAG: family 10 glycosylhydrolase [Kiritimatiellae bacterium]|nr:family 10 glycosylhydrolase [Kiritimatiellia bacterium]